MPATIEANDNRHAAGTLAGRVLSIRLEARPGSSNAPPQFGLPKPLLVPVHVK